MFKGSYYKLGPADKLHMVKRHIESLNIKDVKEAFAQSSSILEAAQKLGMQDRKSVYRTMREISSYFEISLPIYDYSSAAKNLSNFNRLPDEEFFKFGVTREGANLKTRMLQLDIPYRCSIPECPLATTLTWVGQKITLQVDHVNGNSLDNRLENLRFLCPNCHSQTETYGAKNRQRYTYCACGRKIIDNRNTTECVHHGLPLIVIDDKASAPRKSKIQWPSDEEILSTVRSIGYRQYAQKLGVSDNAIRKHLANKIGVINVPKGKPTTPKSRVTKGMTELSEHSVHDIISMIEKPGENTRAIATKLHVTTSTLQTWLEEQLGQPYARPRNLARKTRPATKITYPDLEEILNNVANQGWQKTAEKIGVTERAVDKWLRKQLPESVFPFSKTGYLNQYKNQLDVG